MHRKERKGWSRKDIDGEDVLIKEDSLLHCLQWHRVILDEAHNIKVWHGMSQSTYILTFGRVVRLELQKHVLLLMQIINGVSQELRYKTELQNSFHY